MTPTPDGGPRVRDGASAASFGLSGSLARGLMDAGWSSAAAVSVRILLAAVVLAPLAVVQLRGRWELLRRNLPLVGVYGLLAVAGCQLAFFNAVERMPVGVALLIEYMSPVAVIGWLWLTRGQRPGPRTVAGALLADRRPGARAGPGVRHRRRRHRHHLGVRRDGRRHRLLPDLRPGRRPAARGAGRGRTDRRRGGAARAGRGGRAALRRDDGRRALRRRQPWRGGCRCWAWAW